MPYPSPFNQEQIIRKMYNPETESLEVGSSSDKGAITLKYTTTSTDYDLLQDIGVQNALTDLGFDVTGGLNMELTVFVDSQTQIKINDAGFYNDFISDLVFETKGLIEKVIIKDTGINGTIEIRLK